MRLSLYTKKMALIVCLWWRCKSLAMFYNQPLQVRFGTELRGHLDHPGIGIAPYWDSLDIAVAWVREAGVVHLRDSFERFLVHGGTLTMIVGIDLKNTTREGLQALLDLEAIGTCETFVHHNEAGSVFHPKVYLFRNSEDARLIVGSNNLTAAGLFSNVEAGLQLDTHLSDQVIGDAMDAFSSWRDTATKLVHRLDGAFLSRLVAEGYVPTEAAVRRDMTRASSKRAKGAKLFGSRSYSPPKTPTPPKPSVAAGTPAPTAPLPASPATTPSPSGSALLMRLRKASTTDRPTQTQIPLRVAQTFFAGVSSVQSAHSGVTHDLHPASARGAVNTIKLEIPEMRHFVEPVARFEKTGSGVIYEVHDATSSSGKQILSRLQAGHSDGSTQTSIKDLASATWWRFI